MGPEWAQLRPPAVPCLPTGLPAVGAPEGCLRAPLSVSHVVCDVCTRDLRQLVPFQLEQSLLLSGQKQPQAFFP